MNESLPPELLDDVLGVNVPIVEKWWKGLSENQQALIRELLQFENCTLEFLSGEAKNVDLLDHLPANQKSFDLFNDDWQDNWDENWRSDWREYLTDNPEVSFSFKTYMSGLH